MTADFASCPVCGSTVIPNHDDLIKPHRDGVGRLCPATGFPYKITHHQKEIA